MKVTQLGPGDYFDHNDVYRFRNMVDLLGLDSEFWWEEYRTAQGAYDLIRALGGGVGKESDGAAIAHEVTQIPNVFRERTHFWVNQICNKYGYPTDQSYKHGFPK